METKRVILKERNEYKTLVRRPVTCHIEVRFLSWFTNDALFLAIINIPRGHESNALVKNVHFKS